MTAGAPLVAAGAPLVAAGAPLVAAGAPLVAAGAPLVAGSPPGSEFGLRLARLLQGVGMSWVEIIADRKIQEAQEEGKFDNLQGQGKPLNLEYDPRIPPDQRMAYRLIKEANMIPDWIQAEKDLRQLRGQWQERLEQYRRRRLEQRIGDRVIGAAEAERVDGQRDLFLLEAARGLAELNRRIERFNLIVPTMTRQQVRIPAREWMLALEEEFLRLRSAVTGKVPHWESALPEEVGELRLDNRMPLRRRRESFG